MAGLIIEVKMIYENIVKGIFISRPNRFIAYVLIDGKEEVCHVKNTGRCKELLYEGAEVYLQKASSELRKTKYDLISVKKGNKLINIDSQAPNKVFYEWVKYSGYFKGIKHIKPETKYLNSRFDCYIETADKKIFIEVKGFTLEEEGVVMFPDAPTERGVKHINELCQAVRDGYDAYIFFVIQMNDVKFFTPNRNTHPEFADALIEAENHGVKIKCVDCIVTENSLKINNFIKYEPSI